MKKEKNSKDFQDEELDVISLYRPFAGRKKKRKSQITDDYSVFQTGQTEKKDYVRNDNENNSNEEGMSENQIEKKETTIYAVSDNKASDKRTLDEDTGERYAGVFSGNKTEKFDGITVEAKEVFDGTQVGTPPTENSDKEEILVLEQDNEQAAGATIKAIRGNKKEESQDTTISTSVEQVDSFTEKNEDLSPWTRYKPFGRQKRKNASSLVNGDSESDEATDDLGDLGDTDDEIGESSAVNGATKKRANGKKTKSSKGKSSGFSGIGSSSSKDPDSYSGSFQSNKTDSSSVFKSVKKGTQNKAKSNNTKNSEKAATTEKVGDKFSGVFSVISNEVKETKRSIKSASEFAKDSEKTGEGGRAAFNAGKHLAQEMIAKTRHIFKQVKTIVVIILSAILGPVVAVVAAVLGPLLILLLIVVLVVVAIITLISTVVLGIFSVIATVFMSLFSSDYDSSSAIYQHAVTYSKSFAKEVSEEYQKDSSLTVTIDGVEGYPLGDFEIDYDQVYLCYLFTYEQAEYTKDLNVDDTGYKSSMATCYTATDFNKTNFEKIFDEMYAIETDKDGNVSVVVNTAEKYWETAATTYDYQDDNYYLFINALKGEDEEKQLTARQNTKMMTYGKSWRITEMEGK